MWVATIGSTFAYQNKTDRPILDQWTKTAIHEAVMAGDYDAFVWATAELNFSKVISKDQFVEFVAKRNGRQEEIAVHRQEMKEYRESMQEVMESHDYEWRKELVKDKTMLEKIDTEAKFARLVEMHEHMEVARKIREDLGIERMWSMSMVNNWVSVDKRRKTKDRFGLWYE